ncbi:MAG: hypothetical protein J4G06_07795 [Caldilineaceae bacterium]|nr:hypothetical protein [Caldilineaceae bacterium]
MQLHGIEKSACRPDWVRWNDAEGKALVGHGWKAIRPLSAADRHYDFSAVDVWQERWDRFRANPDA